MAELLRTDVAHEVFGSIRVAVRVAIETRDAAARPLGAPILGLVELLLGERRQQQADALDLLGVQYAVQNLVVVVDREQLTLRDVAEIRPRREIDGRRKLRQKRVRQVEVEVEPREVAALLPLDLVDVELGEHHAAFGMVRMWEGEEASG